jgi:hypothetical protein
VAQEEHRWRRFVSAKSQEVKWFKHAAVVRRGFEEVGFPLFMNADLLTSPLDVRCLPVLTSGSVQAVVLQDQSLDGLAGDDVGVYDLIHVRQRHKSIPHRVRIDHKVRPVLALIKTTRLVRAYFALQPKFSEFLLEAPL